MKDIMVNSLFHCATLQAIEGPHPICVIRAEMSDTGAEAVKLDPHCSLQGHSRNVDVGIRDESRESCSVLQLHHIPSVICPECHTSVVVR